jgi:hypothetical protein
MHSVLLVNKSWSEIALKLKWTAVHVVSFKNIPKKDIQHYGPLIKALDLRGTSICLQPEWESCLKPKCLLAPVRNANNAFLFHDSLKSLYCDTMTVVEQKITNRCSGLMHLSLSDYGTQFQTVINELHQLKKLKTLTLAEENYFLSKDILSSIYSLPALTYLDLDTVECHQLQLLNESQQRYRINRLGMKLYNLSERECQSHLCNIFIGLTELKLELGCCSCIITLSSNLEYLELVLARERPLSIIEIKKFHKLTRLKTLHVEGIDEYKVSAPDFTDQELKTLLSNLPHLISFAFLLDNKLSTNALLLVGQSNRQLQYLQLQTMCDLRTLHGAEQTVLFPSLKHLSLQDIVSHDCLL